MQAGDLDRNVTIKTLAVSRGSSGGVVNTYNTWKTLKANVRWLGGSEFWAAQQSQPENVLVFTFRYKSAVGITVNDRILFDTVEYDIKDIKEINRKQWLEIRTTARVGHGA